MSKTSDNEPSFSINKLSKVKNRSVALCSQAKLEKALDELAEKITGKLADKNPLILSVMIGGLIPTGHLLTRLNFPLQVDYIHVTRYRGSSRGGDLHWLAQPHTDLKGRTILIVEDVLDGGYTLAAIIDYCKQQGAKDVYTAVVVDKQRSRAKDALQHADFTGVVLPNYYIYGFGLDYNHYLRNEFAVYRVSSEDE